MHNLTADTNEQILAKTILIEVVQCTRAGADLKLCGAPGRNLERGPFYIYIKLPLIGKKINERTEVFLLLKQKSLSKKNESSTNMDVTI